MIQLSEEDLTHHLEQIVEAVELIRDQEIEGAIDQLRSVVFALSENLPAGEFESF